MASLPPITFQRLHLQIWSCFLLRASAYDYQGGIGIQSTAPLFAYEAFLGNSRDLKTRLCSGTTGVEEGKEWDLDY